MRTIYLLRHAKSSRNDESVDDFDRPLNKRGRSAATAMGAYFSRKHITPAQVLCSSAKRTRETMERLQMALGPAVPVRYEKGLYLADAPVLLRRMKRLNDSLGSVMLVAHNPGLEQLALLLTSEGDGTNSDVEARQKLAVKFPTGSLAVIEANVIRWHDLKPGCGRLQDFVRAKDVTTA
jgi:phosphohistidine phosphatase